MCSAAAAAAAAAATAAAAVGRTAVALGQTTQRGQGIPAFARKGIYPTVQQRAHVFHPDKGDAVPDHGLDEGRKRGLQCRFSTAAVQRPSQQDNQGSSNGVQGQALSEPWTLWDHHVT